MNVTDKHVVIVGLGSSGLAAARYLALHGARISVSDSQPSASRVAQLQAAVPLAALLVGPLDESSFADADLVVVSPGVPWRHSALEAFRQRGGKVIGDVEVFAQAIQNDGSKVIAITGSNGKTTVTSLVAHLCQHAGLDVVVAGNIGLPVLEALQEREQSGVRPDVWVLELSSFQLESTFNLRPDVATVLNISEDHLDRYDGLLDYAQVKNRIFNGDGVQVLNVDDALTPVMVQHDRPLCFFSIKEKADYYLQQEAGQNWLCCGQERVLNYAQMQLQGLHNASNALAALALCESIEVPRTALLEGLCSFQGLAHRVQLVAEINQVKFIDDSKGTNVGATVAALNGFSQPVLLIVGGEGKGQDFTPLAAACQRIARAVCLIGRDADLIQAALQNIQVPLLRCDSLESATEQAAKLAQPGDVVLLSPACASFDMFDSYVHRAQVFVKSVQQLRGVAA